MAVLTRARNDPRQYDDLAAEWWRPRGAFEPLHWLAKARAELIPDATADGQILLDACCGGGLLAPHVESKGYHHVGVDIGESAVYVARDHGVTTLRGDVTRLPVKDASADVVAAGECFEHVPDLAAFVAEIARVLKPGGLLVCDTLADTKVCKTLLVDVAERLPFVPAGIHDPALFVDPKRLQRVCAGNGIDLKVRGLRPSLLDAVAHRAGRKEDVRMLPMRWTGVLYQGVGRKR